MTDDMHIVLGCPDFNGVSLQTIPGLKAAALFADRLTVIIPNYGEAHSDEVTRALGSIVDVVGPGEQFDDEDWPDVDEDRPFFNTNDVEAESAAELDLSHALADAEIHGLEWARRQAIRVVLEVEELLMQPNVFPIVVDRSGVLHGDAHLLARFNEPTKVKKEADARLGTGLIDSLPNFEALDIRAVKIVRDHLQGYLTPFRGYVLEESKALVEVGRDEAAVGDVIHEIYLGKVRPALDTLNQEAAASKLIQNLLRNAAGDPKGFVNSVITLGISQLGHLPLGASVSMAAATHFSGIEFGRRQAVTKMKHHQLYFLHALEGRLPPSSR